MSGAQDSRRSAGRIRPPTRQAGFTIIEVMIALLILLIGIAGILSLQMVSVRATAFSRHATEASVVAEDKLEFLRTLPADFVDPTSVNPKKIMPGQDVVDGRGVEDPAGNYTRSWSATRAGEVLTITLQVTWLERGSEPYTITMTTKRGL